MSLFGKLKDLFIDVEEIEVDEPEEIVPKKNRKEKNIIKENKMFKKEDTFKKDNYMEMTGQAVKEEVREMPFKIPKVMEDDIKKEENNDEMFMKFNENMRTAGPKDYKEMIPKTREEKHNNDSFLKFENPYATKEMHSQVKPQIKSDVKNVVKSKESKVDEPLKVASLYKDPEGEKKSTTFISKKKEPDKTLFKASPVISPIYGILDKNYKNEELFTRNENSYELQRLSKKIDFDTVRRKAYGNLSEDIKKNLCEDCELLKEVKKLERIKETELLYDMMDDEDDNENGPSIEDAYDNYSDLGISYEKKEGKVVVNDDEVIINNNNKEKVREDIEVYPDFEEIKSIDNEKKTKNRKSRTEHSKSLSNEIEIKDEEMEEDLFGLIDSMYEEREES